MSEINAYHEAGHAWAALHFGAEVRRVTIDPEWDDGPARHGDTQVVWPIGRISQPEFQRRSVLVALAGPVAEMIHLGHASDLDAIAEWTADWLAAWHAAAPLAPAPAARRGLLERCSLELFRLLNDPAHWELLATIVDHLLAHETLDHEMLDEIVGR